MLNQSLHEIDSWDNPEDHICDAVDEQDTIPQRKIISRPSRRCRIFYHSDHHTCKPVSFGLRGWSSCASGFVAAKPQNNTVALNPAAHHFLKESDFNAESSLNQDIHHIEWNSSSDSDEQPCIEEEWIISTPVESQDDVAISSLNLSPSHSSQNAIHCQDKLAELQTTSSYSVSADLAASQPILSVASSQLQQLGNSPPVINCELEDITESVSSPTESISSAPSSPAMPDIQKGSEWLQNVVWRLNTPVKVDQPDKPASPESAKGKCKFTSDGFAQQLQRLQARESSESAVWAHRKSLPGNITAGSKSLLVEIKEIRQEGEILWARCEKLEETVLKNGDKYANASPDDDSSKGPSTVEPKPATMVSQSGSCSQTSLGAASFVVLFSHSACTTSKLSRNSVVRIYAPWKKLQVPSYTVPVLACIYFMEVISTPVDVSEQLPAETLSERVIFQWHCSCVKDPGKPLLAARMCPEAHEATGFFINCPSGITHRVNTGMARIVSSPVEPRELTDMVVDSNLSIIADPFSDSPHHLCQTKECVLHGVNDVRGCSWGRGVTISCRVQKAWCLERPCHGLIMPCVTPSLLQSLRRWHLMLQDLHGIFCEVRLNTSLTANVNSAWSQLVKEGEGQVYRFSGMHMLRKMHVKRYPSLLNFFQKIWNRQKDQGVVLHQQTLFYVLTPLPQNSPQLTADEGMPPYVPLSSKVYKSIDQENHHPVTFASDRKVFSVSRSNHCPSDLLVGDNHMVPRPEKLAVIQECTNGMEMKESAASSNASFSRNDTFYAAVSSDKWTSSAPMPRPWCREPGDDVSWSWLPRRLQHRACQVVSRSVPVTSCNIGR